MRLYKTLFLCFTMSLMFSTRGFPQEMYGFLRVSAGWNYFSMPVIPANGFVDSVLTIPHGPVTSWVLPNIYSPTPPDLDTLRMGYAYVANFSASGTIPVRGRKVYRFDVPVDSGWSIITGISHPVPFNGLGAGLITSIVYYFTGDPNHPSYHRASSIEPGRAYVAKISREDLMLLNISAPHGMTTISHRKGWNLISLPFTMSRAEVDSMFNLATHTFSIPSPKGGYTAPDTFVAGVGYWAKFPEDGNNIIADRDMYSITIAVHEGWNLIGGFSDGIFIERLLAESPGIVASNFYGYDRGYYATGYLAPGQAYWVKCASEGYLRLIP